MSVFAAFRTSLATLAVCSGLYTGLVLAVGQLVTPATANGQLVMLDGTIVGSRQVAQKFEAPAYLWPRPSAVDYNATAAGGSNKSVANPELRTRAEALIARYGANAGRPLPAELATASGSGLDPHISLDAALWQARRVAAARGVPEPAVAALLRRQAGMQPRASGTRRINVLEANLALDTAFPLREAGG